MDRRHLSDWRYLADSCVNTLTDSTNRTVSVGITRNHIQIGLPVVFVARAHPWKRLSTTLDFVVCTPCSRCFERGYNGNGRRAGIALGMGDRVACQDKVTFSSEGTGSGQEGTRGPNTRKEREPSAIARGIFVCQLFLHLGFNIFYHCLRHYVNWVVIVHFSEGSKHSTLTLRIQFLHLDIPCILLSPQSHCATSIHHFIHFIDNSSRYFTTIYHSGIFAYIPNSQVAIVCAVLFCFYLSFSYVPIVPPHKVGPVCTFTHFMHSPSTLFVSFELGDVFGNICRGNNNREFLQYALRVET